MSDDVTALKALEGRIADHLDLTYRGIRFDKGRYHDLRRAADNTADHVIRWVADVVEDETGRLTRELSEARAELAQAREAYQLKVADFARETLAVETLARVLLDDNHSPEGYHAQGDRCRHCAALRKALRREPAPSAVEAPAPERPCGSCNGERWVDDENWQPEDYERAQGRVIGSGRIPCGICNHGGWSIPDGRTATSVSVPDSGTPDTSKES